MEDAVSSWGTLHFSCGWIEFPPKVSEVVQIVHGVLVAAPMLDELAGIRGSLEKYGEAEAIIRVILIGPYCPSLLVFVTIIFFNVIIQPSNDFGFEAAGLIFTKGNFLTIIIRTFLDEFIPIRGVLTFMNVFDGSKPLKRDDDTAVILPAPIRI
jgi:hypothetical protein